MISAVHPRGANVGGLLRYLFGPGKREEHVRPRVVAAWDGAGPLVELQPPVLPGGWHDVRALTDLLQQPVRAGFGPPAKPVWHTSIRAHPNDRILSDDPEKPRRPRPPPRQTAHHHAQTAKPTYINQYKRPGQPGSRHRRIIEARLTIAQAMDHDNCVERTGRRHLTESGSNG